MKRSLVIKDINIGFTRYADGENEGCVMFWAYEDSECRYPSSTQYSFAGIGLTFMEVVTDFFSIFPVKDTAFIKGRKIEIEYDDKDRHIISIKGLDTGRVFNANKYSESKSNLSDYYN